MIDTVYHDKSTQSPLSFLHSLLTMCFPTDKYLHTMSTMPFSNNCLFSVFDLGYSHNSGLQRALKHYRKHGAEQ